MTLRLTLVRQLLQPHHYHPIPIPNTIFTNTLPCCRRHGPHSSFAAAPRHLSSTTAPPLSPLSAGLGDILTGYISGEKKVTEVAHLVWKHVVRKGDTVVDATCGNGYDTLAMTQMAKGDSSDEWRVYGMDVQQGAIEKTQSVLETSLSASEMKSVNLFSICHSKMAEVVPKNSPVRLVAFNLGYLPGGDKTLITKSDTTLLALEASKNLLISGGIISIVAYVGHPGGREEYGTVQAFASELPGESWACSQIQMLNRPLAPILVLMFKK